MKSAKLFLGLLAFGLLTLVPGLAHAQSSPNGGFDGRLRGFEGEVIDIPVVSGGQGQLTIKDLNTGEERVIRLTFSGGQPHFGFKTPGDTAVSNEARVKAIRTIEPGTAVAVLVRPVGGQWQAVEVLVKPEEPTIAPRTGVVMDSDREEGTITILTSDGTSRTLQIEAGEPVPADGDLIIAFAGPGQSSAGPAGPERVTGLTRAAEVRERLERHLEEIASEKHDLSTAGPTVTTNHAASLMGLLDRQTSSHFQRLERALDHSTTGNRLALVQAIVRASDARKQGLIKAEAARNTIARTAVKIASEGNARPTGRPDNEATRAAEDQPRGQAAGGTGPVNRKAEATRPAADKAARDAQQAAEQAARDAEQAAEEAARDAEQAAEEAARDAEQVAEEAARDAEQAAEEAARDIDRLLRRADR